MPVVPDGTTGTLLSPTPVAAERRWEDVVGKTLTTFSRALRIGWNGPWIRWSCCTSWGGTRGPVAVRSAILSECWVSPIVCGGWVAG